MIATLLNAGSRLAEALAAENAALAALDLGRAGALARTKIMAGDAFAAATETCARLKQSAPPQERSAARAMAGRLQELGAENRRLLQRAIALQSRVIETIAQAALPSALATPGYVALSPRPMTRQVPATSIQRSA